MFAIIALAILQILLPLYFAYVLWRGDVDSRAAWLLRAAGIAAFALWLFLSGRWDWFGYWLRYAFVALLLFAAIAGTWRTRRLPWIVGKFWRGWSRVNDMATLAIALGFLAFTLPGYGYSGRAVELAAPLRGGAFYVAQGGGAPLLNYHNSYPPQRYAMDIVALNGLGMRAGGLYPSRLEPYVIFGADVHSPCDGAIVERVDGMEDLAPPEREPSRPAGNHVIIVCGEARVVLAHLQNGSVTEATQVAVGDVVGRVGNSGNTSEPHLHMHAERNDGRGVPILIGGRFLTRNDIF